MLATIPLDVPQTHQTHDCTHCCEQQDRPPELSGLRQAGFAGLIRCIRIVGRNIPAGGRLIRDIGPRLIRRYILARRRFVRNVSSRIIRVIRLIRSVRLVGWYILAGRRFVRDLRIRFIGVGCVAATAAAAMVDKLRCCCSAGRDRTVLPLRRLAVSVILGLLYGISRVPGQAGKGDGFIVCQCEGNCIPTYKSTGVEILLHQSIAHPCWITLIVNPSSLLAGEYRPVSLYQPDKKSLRKLHKLLRSILDKVGIEQRLKEFKLSRCDLTQDIYCYHDAG